MKIFLVLILIIKVFEAQAEPTVGCSEKDLLPLKQDTKESSKWFPPENVEKPLAQVFIFHGLNTSPSAMDDMAQFLSENGVEVLRGSLTGHDNLTAWKNVTIDDWMNDFKRHYCLSLTNAKNKQVPHYFIGYSIGSLLSLYFQMLLDQEYEVDKVVLLAPPIATFWYTRIFKTLFFLGDGLIIPSLSVKEYRAHKGTSLAAYRILYSLENEVKAGDWSRINNDTLVFLEPNDNLVKSSKVKSLIKSKNLNNWEVVDISTKYHHLKKKLPHLIINEASLGKDEWEKMQICILKYLGLKKVN